MSITDGMKADIEASHLLRGRISNAYAQVEFLLGDLILRCRAFPEYDADTKTFTHSAKKRAKKVASMLGRKGALTPFADELRSVIEQFEQIHTVRNLLAHGWAEYLHAQGQGTVFRFKKWDRDDAPSAADDLMLVRVFRLQELRAEADSMASLANTALRVFMVVHAQLGWTATPQATSSPSAASS